MTRMDTLRCRRPILAAAVALVALPALISVPSNAAPVSGPLSFADWANEVWSSARSGQSDTMFEILESLPQHHEVAAVEGLRARLDRRNEHLEAAATEREDRLDEAWTELDENLAGDDLSETLRTAVEIYSLSDDKAAFLANAKIVGLVARAEQAAREAEAESAWLDAQEILFRLNLLYEDDQRYEADLDRTSTRLMMIRLYAPERLHELRNERRIAEDLDPLPPFNRMGEDWHEKLAGIEDPNVVVRAINHAQLAHVDGADMTDLLVGALNNVKTLVTTPDVALAFPKLKDKSRVDKFVQDLDRQIQSLEARRGNADGWDLTRTLRQVIESNESTVNVDIAAMLHEFGNGAMAELDQFSGMIWPDELRQFQKTTQGRFTGVGIQIQLDDAQRLKVVTPLEGTPAQRAGILPGDIIAAVDDESTIGITLSGAVERITGERGTPVTLTIERQGAPEPLKFELFRDEIPIYSVKGWKRNGPRETDWDWYIDEENHIGYVRLTQFADGMTNEFDNAVREMRRDGDLQGLIVDLRFNPGGLLTEAVDLTNRFVSEGVIVSQHDATGREREVQKARRSSTTVGDIPVVVLINEGSASASEIVAGALQDHGKAVLVGARSFGKGSVQNVYDIGRGLAALRLTIQYYRLPNGRLIHRRPNQSQWGIDPDVSIDMSPTQIGDALRIRQDADVLPIDENGEVVMEGEAPDPTSLVTDGVDLQLETALLLVQSQSIAKKHGLAVLAPRQDPVLQGG